MSRGDYGFPARTNLQEYQQLSWWPTGTEARIHAGQAGHEEEIVVNFDAYDRDHPVNDLVFDAFVQTLPESWKVEDRGTRIEVHPSGRFFGGYCEDDVLAVRAALTELGFQVGTITQRRRH